MDFPDGPAEPIAGYREEPDEKSIGKSVRFLRRTYSVQASKLAMLGLCITLSGVRRLGRRVVCKKKTNLRTMEGDGEQQ